MSEGIKILCTLGPSTMAPAMIKKLDEMDVDIFRINLSHTPLEEVEKTIERIVHATRKPLCLDLEGAQIRSGYMKNHGVYFRDGDTVKIWKNTILGDSHNICLTPPFAMDHLAPGDLVSIDFDTLLLQIYERQGENLIAQVVSGGFVGSNKAVTVDKDIALPACSIKDMNAIAVGLKHGVSCVALSFASRRRDVEELRERAGKKIDIISKIENKEGLQNIVEIVQSSDAVLLDRGDMSRQIPIEMLPFLQKQVIAMANQYGRPVYVATNLLESMVDKRNPTRAEVNDIINTLIDGANGLVLAAETAVGKNPLDCVNMVRRSIKSYQIFKEQHTLSEIAAHHGNALVLVEPHGGILVNRMNKIWPEPQLQKMPKLFVDESVLFDAEQIAIGSYSPLEGFMGREEIDSVLDSYKLLSGVTWTMPIVLSVRKQEAEKLAVGEPLALASQEDGGIYAVMHLDEIYPFDFESLAQRWYQTTSVSHPGVERLRTKGDVFLAGKIDLVRRLETPFKAMTLTPLQTRHIFEKKGWNSIVGFHTRNVVHRAHEYIQLTALDRHEIDGLFLHPIIGFKKKQDFSASIILKSYRLMLEKYYPKNNVVLGAFLSFSRYAGPREAVFTALCRKNFGCTHFIVGRDHTGVGDFYGPYAARDLFERLGDIGLKPIFFDEVYFDQALGQYVEKNGSQMVKEETVLRISGSEARRMLVEGQLPPEWFMRQEISEMIIDEIKNGNEVFVA